jgi:hypothetical protein
VLGYAKFRRTRLQPPGTAAAKENGRRSTRLPPGASARHQAVVTTTTQTLSIRLICIFVLNEDLCMVGKLYLGFFIK